MAVITIVAHGLNHQSAHAQALQQGLARHGIASEIVSDVRQATTPVTACWGWRIGKQLRQAGREVLVMERGYLGDRFAWTSLGWNGLNGRAAWPAPQDAGERFERHFGHLQRPWRRQDGYALIVGQVQGDAALANVDIDGWYRRAARAMSDRGFDIRFREHPESVRRGGRTPLAMRSSILHGSLDQALAGAAVVVTWNSNTGVDAAMAGVPVITCDQGAMAWPVAGHGLDAAPVTPDRAEWCRAMAWRQWTLDEIASGEAWEVVRHGAAIDHAA